MKKRFLIFIPTLILFLGVLLNVIFKKNNIRIDTVDLIYFLFSLYGMVFIAPCYYVFCIERFNDDKSGIIRYIMISVILIVIDGIIIYPDSIFANNMTGLNYHGSDVLSMYWIIPLCIVFFGVAIVEIIKYIYDNRKI